MQKELVSIITPCYNSGKFVHRLLDSVLMQDYPHVQMICIDDGSTDNTREVVEGYLPKFEEKGYMLKYIYQKNGGQSVAVNNALKLVTGEYLVWPDSDDYYNDPQALSTFVKTLKDHGDDTAVVRSLPINVSEVDTHEISRLKMNEEISKENQFLNCLNSSNFIWPPVNYMIRMNAFDAVNPQREIYTEKNAGQNWQMLLPLMYSFKCHTLDKHLSCVLIREDSHSRGQYKGFEQVVAKFASYKNTILSTLDRIAAMPDKEREHYKKQIVAKYKVQELQLTINHGERHAQIAIENELIELGIHITSKQKLTWYLQRHYISSLIFRVISRIIKI